MQDAVQNAYDVETESIGDAKHIFSHIEWHMTGYRVKVKKEAAERLKAYWNLVEVTGEEFREEVAMPSAFRAYVPH